MGLAVKKEPGVGRGAPSSLVIPEEVVQRSLESSGVPQGLQRWQHQRAAESASIPLPSEADELWRYTKPGLFPLSLFLSPAPSAANLLPWDSERQESQAEFRQGKDLTKEQEAFIQEVVESREKLDNLHEAVEVRRSATLSQVRLIDFPAGSENDPLVLSETCSAEERCFSSLLVVRVRRGATATLLYTLDGGADSLVAPRVEIVLEQGAQLSFHTLQRTAESATVLSYHKAQVSRDAKLTHHLVSTGGKVARVDLDCLLRESGAEAELYSMQLATGSQHLDLHSNQAHLAPHCYSKLLCKNALLDRARSVYYGYIRVAEQAHQTDAYQTNRNLLLSPKARADTIPNLEIKANDVKCSHGASVGQLSGEELFYLLSRGLNREDAEKLLLEGFFAEIAATVAEEGIREMLFKEVTEGLR